MHGDSFETVTLWMLQCEVLANESFKASKVIRHLKTKYSTLADGGTEFFKRKAEIIKKARLDNSGSYKMLLPLKFNI
jgi:hypothetical protein